MSLEEKQQEVKERISAELEANSIPLPGAAGDAIASGPIQVGPYSVRKVCRFDWRIWQETGNAIVLTLAELSKPEDQRQPVEDSVSAAVAVWMLINTIPECIAALKSGHEKFKDMCVAATEGQMEKQDFDVLFAAVMEQVKRSTLTIISHAVEKENATSANFCRETGGKPPMALAG